MTVVDDELLARAAALLDRWIGLKPDLVFRPHLARALRDVATARHVDVADVVAAIAAGGSVLDDVVGRITVQETAFFRHPEQFRTLVDVLLPQIGGTVHVWSAASSNGQEAYSLAMTLREHGRAGSVLATDVSPAAVRRSADAVYDARELGAVSPLRLRRHFTEPDAQGRRHVRRSVRDLVTVRCHNLLRAIPDEVHECQIVFCRNVLIYFTPQHQARFLAMLADAMLPTACLVVGAAETLLQMGSRFEPERVGSSYLYRPRPARPPSRRAAPPLGPPLRGVERRPPTPVVDARVAGLLLLATGDCAAAVVEFRRWAYGQPDDPLANFHLGTALDQAGHPQAARRAFRSALAAFDDAGPDVLDATLGGFDRRELRRLLVSRSNAGPAGDDRRAGPRPVADR